MSVCILRAHRYEYTANAAAGCSQSILILISHSCGCTDALSSAATHLLVVRRAPGAAAECSVKPRASGRAAVTGLASTH